MSTFLTAVGTVITSLLGQLTAITTALLANEAFQIVAAVVVFSIMVGLVVGLIKGIKRKRKR